MHPGVLDAVVARGGRERRVYRPVGPGGVLARRLVRRRRRVRHRVSPLR